MLDASPDLSVVKQGSDLAESTVIDEGLRRTAAQIGSLGRNCEFGMVRRRCKLEPISLLRWAGGLTPDIMRAFESEFAGVLEAATGTAVPRKAPVGEQRWWLRCSRTNLLFHTGESAAYSTVEEATARVRQRNTWLAGKQMESIRAGGKLFLHSSPDFVTDEDALAFAKVFREVGGMGPLLLVGSGHAEVIRPLEPQTWFARFPKLTGLQQANTLDLPAWLDLLAQVPQQIALDNF